MKVRAKVGGIDEVGLSNEEASGELSGEESRGYDADHIVLSANWI
jgi:hypothetical protein